MPRPRGGGTWGRHPVLPQGHPGIPPSPPFGSALLPASAGSPEPRPRPCPSARRALTWSPAGTWNVSVKGRGSGRTPEVAQGREVHSPCLEGRPRWGLGRGRGRRAGVGHGRASLLSPAGPHRAPTVSQAPSFSWVEGHPWKGGAGCCYNLHSTDADAEAEAQWGAVTPRCRSPGP